MSNSLSSNSAKIAGVILAAGKSSRMGCDKALLPLGNRTFLEHLANLLAGEVEHLCVVLGHHADQIEQQVRLPPGSKVLHNPNYSQGQLSSLHVALQSLDIQHTDAAIVCLVDHPAITKHVLRSLRNRFFQAESMIVIPTWRGRRGHPVLFSNRLFQELLDASLEQGARSVVRRHSEEIELVEVDEEGIIWDVDRPEDFAALQSRWGSPTRGVSEPSEEHS